MSSAPLPSDLPDIIGGRYRVVGEIGRGGMGRVLKVVHQHTGETLAMKVLIVPSMGRERAIERFRREARTLAQVRGDHVVRVMDADLAPELGGSPYLVMELLEGEDLGRYVTRRGRLQASEAVPLLYQVAEGLARVHKAGLVHRDLKPANIFLHSSDGRIVVKLLDFGLVRPVGRPEAGQDAVTGQGEILGTPLFMSPEQVHAAPDTVGAATDIWATGILAYYVLTGQAYWNLQELPRGIFDIGAAALTPPSMMDPALTVTFDAWFLRSCARNPVSRWPDPLTQWRELARALGLPADAVRSILPSLPPTIASGSDETRVATAPSTHALSPTPSTPSAGSARQRRQVTVLFYRLVHSDRAKQEMDPEEFEASEARLHAQLDRALGDLRQTSSQMARGGRFVFFGYPVAYGSDAGRAADAALRLTGLVAELSAAQQAAGKGALQVRVGIHTGVVLAGPSAEIPGASDVVGQALGVATDLEHDAAPGEIVASDATWRLLRGRFEGRPVVGERHVITGRTPDTGAVRVSAMVGRHAELAILQGCLQDARNGESQTVLVTGEVGIGKSRLVDALRSDPDAVDVEWLQSQCSPFFQRTAFHPVLDLLRRVIAKSTGRVDAGSVGSTDVTAMTRAIGLAEPVAESLEFLLSLPGTDRSSMAGLSPQLRRERAIQALIAVIHRIAGASPVVLVVEDLHWADPSTLEWLDRLSMLKQARLMTVLTARPEFSPSWSSPAMVTPLQLRRLGQAQTAELIATVAGSTLPADVAALVARTTDGIPLFIEELTRLVAERPGTSTGTGLTGGGVPTSLDEALNARLDRLGSARATAELAAVIGPTFELDDLRALAGDEASVSAQVQELVRAKVVQPLGLPPHTSYAFQHALMREAAYGSLPRDTRRALHTRVAQTLAARGHVAPEVLAHHFEEAGMPMEAAGLLLQAGQAALARSANAEARGHFRHGTEILEKYERTAAPGQPAVDPALDITLRTMHGMAWVVSRGYAVPEAEAEFSGAMTRVRALGDRDVPGSIPALFANWVFMFVRGRTADAAEQSARLRRSADRSGDPGAVMMASLAEGTVLLDRGTFAESIERFDDGLSRYDPVAHTPYRFMYGQDPRMYGMVFKAWALWCVGSPDEALTLVHEAVQHTRALHHPHSLGFALAIQGLIEEYRGDVDALTKTAAELTELSAEQGWLQWLAFAQLLTGVVHAQRGREAEGIAEMRAGRELSRAMGEKAGAAHYDSILAAAELRAGRLDDAAATLAIARAVVESGQHAFEADVVRLEGELAFARGDAVAAERAFRRAREVAAAQGARSYELRAEASLESLLRASSPD